MKLSTGISSGRAAYYDRSPLAVIRTFSITTGPHANTIRDTYTVPAARSAFFLHSMADIIRATAATTAGEVGGGAENSSSSPWLTKARITTLNANDSNIAASSIGVLMQAGNVLHLRTVDVSTGGTVTYQLQNTLTEFDA